MNDIVFTRLCTTCMLLWLPCGLVCVCVCCVVVLLAANGARGGAGESGRGGVKRLTCGEREPHEALSDWKNGIKLADLGMKEMGFVLQWVLHPSR